ncbi:MAG: FecR domain-containing protein [Proteobacteria bacterium]|nr:FecR domain-containing protein [Pseudomonadota bacterium]
MGFIGIRGLRNHQMRRFGVSLISTAAALALGDAPAVARVGIASVVEGEPKGQPPAAAERILRVGIDMSADEKVTTTASDRAHLVFNDGSSITIGPNSVIVIDKYVYDPDQKSGEMSLKLSRGTLRFVGGVISKKSEVKIDTPSASMGIRGGILTVAIAPSGATKADFLFGTSFSITSEGVTRTTTQPGTEMTVTPGQPPAPPAPIPPGSLASSVAAFEQGPPSSNGPGGVFNVPTTGGASPSNVINTPRGPAGRSATPSPANNNASNTRPRAAIRAAVASAGVSKVNSAMPPQAVIAATPSTQQLATLLTAPSTTSTASLQPGGSAGPLGAASPVQGSGPLLAGGPLVGSGPVLGGGPMQASGPLQGAGALFGAGPLLGAGPVEGSGPLLGSGPLQGTAPLQTDGGFAATGPVLTFPQARDSGPSPLQLASLPAAVLTATPQTPPTPLTLTPDPTPSSNPLSTAPTTSDSSTPSTTSSPTTPTSDPTPPVYTPPPPSPTPVTSQQNICSSVSCN